MLLLLILSTSSRNHGSVTGTAVTFTRLITGAAVGALPIVTVTLSLTTGAGLLTASAGINDIFGGFVWAQM